MRNAPVPRWLEGREGRTGRGAAVADELKIRIGVGIDGGTGPGEFGAQVDLLEKFGVDSLWLPEAVYSERIDPFVGMTHALARTTKLKVGTGVAVLPGRNPV